MRLTRRTTLALAAGAATGGLASARAAAPASPCASGIASRPRNGSRPCRIGSGRMGAMVFGGVAAERLQLNEDTLWAGGPYDPANPEALKALPEIRALIDAGDYAKATEIADARFMAVRPSGRWRTRPIGDLKLTFPGLDGQPTDYVRDLDLDGAIATTRFTVGGTRYTRRGHRQLSRPGHRRAAERRRGAGRSRSTWPSTAR